MAVPALSDERMISASESGDPNVSMKVLQSSSNTELEAICKHPPTRHPFDIVFVPTKPVLRTRRSCLPRLVA
jgi:hypothetical protein